MAAPPTWYRDASWGLSPPDSRTRSALGTVTLRMVSSDRRLKDRPREPLMASNSASLGNKEGRQGKARAKAKGCTR
jgi:hypothetical protein